MQIKLPNFFRDTETGGRKGSFNKAYDDNFNGNTQQVETTNFDNLISAFGETDFVKIDVEGFEGNIVEGLTKSLLKTVFLVEVRDETKKEIFEYFNMKGFRCYYIDQADDIVIHDY